MTRTLRLVLAGALVLGVLSTTGCLRRERIESSGEVGNLSESVELGSASAMALDVSMGAGKLRIDSGDLQGDAFRGEFDYRPDRLRPEVTSSTEGTGTLAIDVDQPDLNDSFPFGNLENDWDLLLAPGVPTTLVVQMGAGDANVDLSEVNLTELDLALGAGKTEVDLSGEYVNDITGSIQAGAGEIVIRLPEDIPVKVTGVSDGIGDFSADGFSTDGGALVNSAWAEMSSQSDVAVGSIELTVQRGVGDVRLELVD